VSREVRLVLNQLYSDLQSRPLDFYEDRHTLKDRATDTEYWTSNGLPFYGVYQPVKLNFGLLGGLRFASMLRKWRAASVIARARAVCVTRSLAGADHD
jgi:hypothetical protein